jgi:hypothetical protein
MGAMLIFEVGFENVSQLIVQNDTMSVNKTE